MVDMGKETSSSGAETIIKSSLSRNRAIIYQNTILPLMSIPECMHLLKEPVEVSESSFYVYSTLPGILGFADRDWNYLPRAGFRVHIRGRGPYNAAQQQRKGGDQDTQHEDLL